MSELVNLSDYYLQDVPAGTLLVPNYVTSPPENPKIKGQVVNKTKWKGHKKPYEWVYCILGTGHNFASFLGRGIKSFQRDTPDERIIQHWKRIYGENHTPEFTSIDNGGCKIVTHPDESLPPEQHSVDPDVHYMVQSKEFIGKIDVPQAKILAEFKSPCVLKVTHGGGGSGVRFVRTIEEFNREMGKLNTEMPDCEIIITELIEDINTTYSCHFYVTKTGEVQWIGVCEQYLSGTKSHGKYENIMRMDEQESLKELLYPPCKIVGEALHREGYFGYCGVDVVVDKTGQTYVVDINSRLCESASLQLSTLHVHNTRGYTFGIHRRGIPFPNVTLEELISMLEGIEDGMAVLVSAPPDEVGFKGGIRVYANSLERIENIFTQINSFCDNKNI